MDINHKLDLIQELRKEQERRERYIYKNGYRKALGEHLMEEKMESSLFSSFRLRLLAAILLFLCFFVMENTETQLGELTHRDIVAYIEKSMDLETMISSIELE